MKRNTIAILASLTLCACRSVPQETRDSFGADFDMADFVSEFPVDTTASVSPIPWRQLISDQRLRSLIDTALVRNTSLEVARQRIIQSQAALQSARLAFLPSLSLAPNAQTISYASTGSNMFSLNAEASWNLSGSVVAAKNMAAWNLKKDQAMRDAVQADLILQISTQYLTLMLLDRQLQLATDDRDSWEKTAKAMQASIESGLVADRTQVLQAGAALLQAESQILTITESIHLAENSICSMLLTAPRHIERSTLDDSVLSLDNTYSSIPLSLIENRPDVEMARFELMYCAGARNLSRSNFFPQVSLSGSMGWTNNVFGVIIDPSEWLLSAIAQLVQPVFSSGMNKARLAQAKADYQIALLGARQTLLDAGNDVNQAMTGYITASGKYLHDEERATQMEEVVRQTELLMEHGSVNIIQVLESRRSLSSAMNCMYQDKFDLMCSALRLYHSLGYLSD